MVETSKLAKARSLLKSELSGCANSQPRLTALRPTQRPGLADPGTARRGGRARRRRIARRPRRRLPEARQAGGGARRHRGGGRDYARDLGAKDPRYGMAADRLADAHVQNGAPQTALPIYKDVLDKMKTARTLATSSRWIKWPTRASAGNSKAAAKAYAELIELMGAQSAGASGGGDARGGGRGAQQQAAAVAKAVDSSMLDEWPGAVARARVRYARTSRAPSG